MRFVTSLRSFLMIFLALRVVLCGDSSAQIFTPDERRILELQDKRSTGDNDELFRYLMSTDPRVRQMAIYALGNIADTNHAGRFNFLLAGPFEDYPDSNDMKAVAFALGQMPCSESKEFTRIALSDKAGLGSESVKYFIDAAGRIGDSTDLERISKLAYSTDTAISRSSAMSIARFGLRGIKSRQSVDALKFLANNSGDNITLMNTAFALWRTGDKKLLSEAKQEIYGLCESEDPQTRMWSFNALGRLSDKLMLMYTMESFLSEPDWRVRVNMLNTLSQYQGDSLADMKNQINTFLWAGVRDESEQVTLSAISSMERFFPALNAGMYSDWKDEAGRILLQVMNEADNYSPNEIAAAAIALAKIKKDASATELESLFTRSNSYKVKSDVLRAFGNFDDASIHKRVFDSVKAEVIKYNSNHADLTGEMIASADLAELYAGFIEMTANMDNRMDTENQKLSRLIFLEFAGSGHPYITAVSLDALQDSIYLTDRDEIASVWAFDLKQARDKNDNLIQLIFIDAFKNLGVKGSETILEPGLSSANYDIATATADAMRSLTGNEYSVNAVKEFDFDWDFLESYSQKVVNLRTSKGDIALELFPNVAPFTVMNFLKLSDSGYFDSTVFHRVVPNFVIQGGDPTGTGYGGPDHSIRSEYNPLTYSAGTLGMASAGKDTEGSQFFITHSATPHLDGRYTVFGRVIRGMDVVDKICLDDYLLKVEITDHSDRVEQTD